MSLRALRTRALILLILALAGVGAVSWWLGGQLVKPVNHKVPLPATFPARPLFIIGPDHPIAAWWLDQGPRSPAVLLLHGIRADRASMIPRAELLARHGFSVLLIDLQGHGETLGTAITLGWRESADARAALEWLHSISPSRRVGVIGCSLGGASVLLGPQPSGYDAVVLEAVYPRVSTAIENRIRIRLGPLAPALTPLLLLQLQPRLHISARDLEPIRSIGRLKCPVLVVAGSDDAHTTLAESRELFAAAAPPKQLWVVHGASHQDFLAFDPAGYEAHVVSFLGEHLRSAGKVVRPNGPRE